MNTLLLAALIGYALGSVPFGLILTKITGAGDLRSIGSGNIGATNVLRTGKKGLAAATLILDLLKGTAAVLIVRHFLGDTQAGWALPELFAGAGALIGHCFPVWLGFKGGKGVATYAGVAFGLGLPLGGIYAAVWIGVLAISRISSAGGLAAALAMPVAAWALGQEGWVNLLIGCSLLVFWKHRDNIRRLLRGEEPRIGQK